MNILFVCSANQNRSKTAEMYFQEKYPQYQFQSGGTNHQECLKNNSQPLTEKLLIWADKVFVMEKHHQDIINKYTKQNYQDKILVLNIKDVYTFMQSELIMVLEEKIKYINMQNSILLLLFLCFACKKDAHIQAYKYASKYKNLQKDTMNVLKKGERFVVIDSRTQGIAFDNSHTYETDSKFIKKVETRTFANPDEAGGAEIIVYLYEPIQQGKTEIRVYENKNMSVSKVKRKEIDSISDISDNKIYQNIPKYIRDTTSEVRAKWIYELQKKTRDSIENLYKPKPHFVYQIIVK